MKTIRSFLVVLAIVLMASTAFAASSQTLTTSKYGDTIREVYIAWTAHTDGTHTYATSSTTGLDGFIVGTWLCRMVTDPDGSSVPTDQYDITLTNSNGSDLLGGRGANRSSTTTEAVVPYADSGTSMQGCVPVFGTLSLSISNAGSGGKGVIRFIFHKEK